MKQRIPITKIFGIKKLGDGHMAKTLIILVLLFDGTLVQEKYELTREMSVSECLQYGDDHREAIAEYKEFKDNLKNGWYLKDGRGTIQGHMCE
jgi:hypothetical protein